MPKNSAALVRVMKAATRAIMRSSREWRAGTSSGLSLDGGAAGVIIALMSRIAYPSGGDG
ncbi:MAG: hypothetical protein Fur0039_18370 [Rhodocyclaceae bacterium]